MDYFKAPENPEYIEQIRKFETSDPAHADLFNSVVEALVNNDEFIRIFAVQIGEKVSTLIGDVGALNMGKAASSHTHDDRYYTESEMNTKLASKSDSSHTHAYLPLSGGTMTGDIHIASDKGLILDGNTCYIGRSANAEMIALWGTQIRFYPEGWATNESLYSVVKIGKDGANYAFYPSQDNKYQIGFSNARWKQLYAVNSVISTSDETMKRNIKPLDENLILQFIMGLNPISYVRTDAESGRKHWGMGAQSVEKLMDELGIDSMDFAGLIKSPKEESIPVKIEYFDDAQVEETNENGQKVVVTKKVRKKRWEMETKEIPGEYRYGLRYEEFIAPIIKVVQMQQEVINSLKKENSKFLSRLENVEKALGLVGNN